MVNWKKNISVIIVVFTFILIVLFSNMGTIEILSDELGNDVPYFIDSDGVSYHMLVDEKYVNKSVYVLGKKKLSNFCEGLGPECRNSINYLLIIPLN